MPLLIALLVGVSSNKRQQMAAKPGMDLFVRKKYTQKGPERATQLAETELNDPMLGRLEDLYP